MIKIDHTQVFGWEAAIRGQGTVITDTPFGAAKVYDTGCASGTLDIYTNY